MSAELYRAAAADLDQYAVDVDDCDVRLVRPCRRRLPEILQGAATAWLEGQLAESASDLRSAAEIMRVAAAAARSRAAAIEAADAIAATAEATEASAVAESPEPVGSPALFF